MVLASLTAPRKSERVNDPNTPRPFTESEFRGLRDREPSLFLDEFPELIDGRIILNAELPKLWTVELFQELAKDEPFDDMRLELIDGEIYEMGIANAPHDSAMGLADYMLKRVFGDGYFVRIGLGLIVSDTSGVAPDLAVVKGSPRDYCKKVPTTALLIVEVSDTTIGKDTTAKAGIYAEAGIEDYWVIDVNNRQLIVHRKPDDFHYSEVTYLQSGDSISPLAVPSASIAVADLLP